MGTNVNLQNPPDEPPHGVSDELLWRLAVRLFRSVTTSPRRCTCRVSSNEDARDAKPRCVSCRQLSPCSGQRMALLGLSAALGAG